MAFFTPELFGISIGYSSAIVNMPWQNLTSVSKYPLGMGELYIRKPEGQELINSETKKNIRIFHSAGENDFGTPAACEPDGSPSITPDSYPSILEAHEQVEKDLVAKGYETRYAYVQKGCHVAPPEMMLQDLPNTLVWAWADWKKKVDQTKANQQTVEEQPSSSVRPSFIGGAISIVSTVAIFYYVY